MKYLPYPGFFGKMMMKKYFCIAALLALFAIEAQAGTGTVISKLYGVTGDGGLVLPTAETLFELDMTDASSTFVLALGNGDDGEEIAFNPDDGLIYHASGSASKIFETIDPGTLAITPVTLSGSTLVDVAGLTYEGSGVFLASDRLSTVGLFSITTAGVTTHIGTTETDLTGLAYVVSTLYAVAKNNDLLRIIDPATGGTLSSMTITLADFTVSGATGLATNPVDDSLWALLKVTDGTSNPAARALAVIDPDTGVATLVGITDVVGMAGITFISGTAVTVTSSVGTPSGIISPLGAQSILSGTTTAFTLTPDTGYVIASVGGTCGGSLVDETYTTASVTADCTVVANFELEPTTKLYGITGDGGLPPETLFRLDMTDASSTFVLELGNGNDGEEIAFNRDDGLLYHASGSTGKAADVILETIDLVSKAVTPVPLSGFNYKEVTGLTYAGSGVLLAGDRTTSVGLSSITTSGVTTNIGNTDMTLMGLAYIGTTLYAVGKSDDLLRTIDPATGATLGSVTITLSGFTLSGATGLTTNPDDNSLWALLKVTDSNDPTARALAVINPATGVATLVGITDVPGLAGIAFEFIPCATCMVTPSVGTGPGTISPSTVQAITSGDTTQFTLSPAANYHIDSVGGTCGGSLVSNTYTTAAITADCTVVANFAIDTFTVTSSVGTPSGSIDPLGAQTIDFGNTTAFTLAPAANYHIDSVGGTCGGSLVNNTYTTAVITSDCTVVANFAIDTFTVTSSVGTPSGSIDPLGAQTIDFGNTTAFTLAPAANYHIDSVGGTCGGSLVSNTFTTAAITANCTVVANFAIDTFDLSYSAGTGGSITGTSPQTVDYGADGTEVTAVADTHYSFVDWSDAVATASRTDINVMADISVTANFAIDTFTVTPSVGTPSGNINPSGPQTVDFDKTIAFTLTPDTHYHIDSVGGTCGGSLDGDTFTTAAITTDCTVVANFAIDVFTVTSSVGTPAGNINPVGEQPADSGTTKQFTLTPDANNHIDSVGGTCGGSLDGDTFTTVEITADCTVIANFAIDTFTVTPSVGTPAGSISPSGAQTVDFNETTAFTLAPDTNYHIDSVGGTCSGTLDGDIFTTAAITTDCTVVANFAIDVFTVTSSVGTPAGNINPVGEQPADSGTTKQFTLTPDANNHIDSVGGTCGGSLDGDTFTTAGITADCTVIANFAIDTFDLTYTAGTGGTISGTTPQTVDYGTNGTEVTAVADAHYSFVDWSDTLATASRTDTNVKADISVTANFEIDTFTVSSSVGTPSGSIDPLGPQTVDFDKTTAFTLTPDAAYRIGSVGGTCLGSLVGDTYTTDAISADCTVVANFTLNTEIIFENGFE